MKPAEQCKDKAGQPAGIPDLAVLQTVRRASSARRSRSPRSRAAGSCPYSGSGVRTFQETNVAQNYYFKKYGKSALHGVFLVPSDLPSTISASTPLFAADEQLGIKQDAEFGVSACRRPVRVHLRRAGDQDAQLHVREGRRRLRELRVPAQGSAGAGREQREGLGLLAAVLRPAPDHAPAAPRSRTSTPGCRSCRSRTRATTPSSTTSCSTTRSPTRSVRRPGSRARCSRRRSTRSWRRADPTGSPGRRCSTAIKGITNFDDNGFIAPTNIGGKIGSKCLIGMQVQNGKFVRVDPTTPGTFDCTGWRDHRSRSTR